MTQRREIESRLALYAELAGILGAMRSFALAELRKVNQRELSQQSVMDSLSKALADLAGSLPNRFYFQSNNSINDIWLIFGSVRGFCGSFNEDVLRCWQSETAEATPLILVGERLHQMVDEQQIVLCVDGAVGSLDAPAVIDRILSAIAQLRMRNSNDLFGLLVAIRDEQGARSQRLWPLSVDGYPASTPHPFTYESPEVVAAGVAEHYLFHSLLAFLLRSIRVENHMRLLQMDTALRHLERGTEELQRQRNRLRQEEIVEEIELMVGRH